MYCLGRGCVLRRRIAVEMRFRLRSWIPRVTLIATLVGLVGCSTSVLPSPSPSQPSPIPSLAVPTVEPSLTPTPSATNIVAWRPVQLDPTFTGATVADLSGEILGAAAIRRLGTNPELRLRLGEAAKDRISKEFSLETMANSYQRIYADVAAGQDSDQ